MALIIVGGQSRKVGKTSVVVGLISALRKDDWLAAKITQDGHEVCPGDGACACVTAEHTAVIIEERDRSGRTDTSRFLVAGAERALWVSTLPGHLSDAMPELREEMAKARNVILESNGVMEFVKPDVYLMVLDPSLKDFKESARKYLQQADALLVPEREMRKVPAEGKRVFRLEPPKYVSEELVEFVRERIKSAAGK